MLPLRLIQRLVLISLPQIKGILVHHLGVVRQPDAPALLAELVSHDGEFQMAGYLVDRTHFEDAAVGGEQHLGPFLGRQPFDPGQQGAGGEQVAFQPLAIQPRGGSVSLDIELLDLQGVLRVAQGHFFDCFYQRSRQVLASLVHLAGGDIQHRDGVQHRGSLREHFARIGVLAALVKLVQLGFPGGIRQIEQGGFVPLAAQSHPEQGGMFHPFAQHGKDQDALSTGACQSRLQALGCGAGGFGLGAQQGNALFQRLQREIFIWGLALLAQQPVSLGCQGQFAKQALEIGFTNQRLAPPMDLPESAHGPGAGREAMC